MQKSEGKAGGFQMLKKISANSNATALFILLFIIVFGAVLSFLSPNFLTAYNIGIIIKQMSFVGMAALGQTLVLITIGTDLSVGTTANLAGILFAIFTTNATDSVSRVQCKSSSIGDKNRDQEYEVPTKSISTSAITRKTMLTFETFFFTRITLPLPF